MLTLTDIHKKFGNNEVLKGVTVDVDEGRVVVILGPSGSGKTTLLRCTNFLETPDSGSISWTGGWWSAARRKKRILIICGAIQQWYFSIIIYLIIKMLLKM